ncbi:Organic hydroperoxide reductase OsmC/OhrA [Alkalibacterium subtropicum]|uniref:Organic hydroperoxide reductase OsmC/OhrA n=1 Tax=Alkalibacterium subtropicum TaxID=753702 RepID=A0A1I1JF46_9LACT|nr:OsmC family protein [Alkalibacterium subtropicum]SFC45238.1 Organic hydroperoxide reductase OsmC/OhrA [Alkalibacterium subtropicum]
MEDHLFEATVHNEDGVEGTAYVEGEGKLNVTVSSPVNDQPGTNPEELFGLALTTCLNATIKSLLKARGLTNKSKVTAKIQLRREDSGAGYYFQVYVFAAIEGLELDRADAIVQSADKRCPVAKLTQNASTITLKTVPYEN